jgi:hypothetical protein
LSINPYKENIFDICLVGHESTTLEGLQFEMAVIRTATDNFSHENKIGEGGFGEVYKVRKHEKVYLFYDKVLCANDGLFSN